MDSFQADLQRRRAAGLYRERRVMSGPQGPQMRLQERDCLSFCSNDYLGLAADPRLVEALQQGAARYGVGSGAAHLVSGHMPPHHALEEELAEFVGRPRALLFSTGYMANQGVIAGLLGRGDRLWQDRLNHASLIDGGLASPARFQRYRHADLADLEAKLGQAAPQGRGMLATDGVFSMDGDLAPLDGLQRIARQRELLLLVDDAHGLGVLGAGGRGSFEHLGLQQDERVVLVGTLGKGFGCFGAFVAGEQALIETLIQQARSYIYTTAQPPAVAEATRASLRIVREETWRRDKLKVLVARFRAAAEQIGLPLMASETPIQPLLAGSVERALRWSDQLQRQGILVTAIRPPTVPEGGARLRITFSAAHSEEQVDKLLDALDALWRREGRMLHKRVLGSGPDLLLIHGWGMNSEVWNTLAEDLSSSYRLTLVDLPGHGGSPCASRPGGLRQWAESVLAVAPPEAIWVGWSLGGSIALQAALSAPARVKALVMVTATPRFVRAADWPHAMDEDTLSGFRAALARDPTTTLDRFLALQAQGGEGARALLRELRVRLAATPPPAAAALDSGLEMLRQVDLRDKLAQLEMPSLWLFGQRDALTPWRCGEQVKRLNGAAQVEVLAGAAHAPFLSHRAQALDLLRGFLEQAA